MRKRQPVKHVAEPARLKLQEAKTLEDDLVPKPPLKLSNKKGPESKTDAEAIQEM